MKKLLFLVSYLISFAVLAQNEEIEMADKFRSDGKIYVVVGIILIILIGLFVYLFSLDRKINKIEKETKGKS